MRLSFSPLREINNLDSPQISQNYHEIHTQHIQLKHKIILYPNVFHELQSFRVCNESSLLGCLYV